MAEIVLNDEQAASLLGATEEVLVLDKAGKVLARIPPTAAADETQIVEEAKRRLATNPPRSSTEEVLDRLEAIGQ